jgi:RES domain-containing protein
MNTITVWRLCAERVVPMAFSGEGSFVDGGRWNPPGVRVVYCSESRSLAALEVLANARDNLFAGPRHWFVISMEIPTLHVEHPSSIPEDWRLCPYSPATQAFGANWIREGRKAVLRVPSAMVPGEFNFMLNPAHPDFRHLKPGKPEPFFFDPRLGISAP